MSETHVHGIDEANMERRTFLKGSRRQRPFWVPRVCSAVRRMLLSRKG